MSETDRVAAVPAGCRVGNYVPLVLALAASLEPGTGYHVTVLHDADCAFWIGGPCNCDPEIRVFRVDESA